MPTSQPQPDGTPTGSAAIPAGLLERLDALPSPSPLAMRLLAVANDEHSNARDLVEIIRQDSALVAKVIALCRRGPRGRQLDVGSLDRAVVLLGFGAVRGAALTVEFVGSLGHGGASAQGFDPLRFWRHALAKAIVAESAARLVRGAHPGRAFVAGLLHDLGAMCLAKAAPALFDAVCDEAENTGRPLDAVAAARLGISASAAGARLAERWNLPGELLEVLRLRGPAALALEGPHRTIVLLAELADRVVRRRHLGGAGFGPTGDGPQQVATALELDAAKFSAMLEGLFEEVAARAEALRIEDSTPASLVSEAMERATRRIESIQHLHGGGACRDPIEDFDSAADPIATLGLVVKSITRASGRRERLLVVLASIDGAKSEIREFGPDGELLAGRTCGEGDLDGAIAVRRWSELRGRGGQTHALPLRCRGATLAVLHRAGAEVLAGSALAEAPLSLWAFALASSLERQRALRGAERLAEAMRALSLARDRVVRDRALASVGEIAAGLAHELNNPLTVVSGRAQLLRRAVPEELRAGIEEIVDAAERASGLVSQLLRSVRPSRPKPRATAASEIIALALRFLPGAGGAAGTIGAPERIDVRIDASDAAPPVCLADPAQAADALAEIVQNALDADPLGRVAIHAHFDPRLGRCSIAVTDAGPGFSDRALQHATDPFFSERPAGRGAGLGLAKARSIVEAAGGSLEARNAPEGGAVVTMTLPAGHIDRLDARGEGRIPVDGRRRSAA
jgi:signal transduction histidine kinase/HD-like signal output (HDOD) protein